MVTPGTFKPAGRALRLTFRFEGGEIDLVRRADVDAMPPASEPTDRRDPEKLAGFWFELQDGAGRTVYRRTTEHPIRTRAEVVQEDGSFVNQASVARSGSFSLLVPQVPEAQEVVLFSSSLDAPDRPGPAREVARTSLRPDRDDPPDQKAQRG